MSLVDRRRKGRPTRALSQAGVWSFKSDANKRCPVRSSDQCSRSVCRGYISAEFSLRPFSYPVAILRLPLPQQVSEDVRELAAFRFV
ncbi:hypothetical protein Trydic_g7227 [Trypoxylus dichotomus]